MRTFTLTVRPRVRMGRWCAAIVAATMAAATGAAAQEAGRPAAMPQAAPGVVQTAAAAREAREFLRTASRAIAHGQRADAARLAAARGPGDAAGLVILARLDAAAGRLEEALARVQLPGAAQPTSDAALERGLILLSLGRKTEARSALAPLASSARSASTPDALLRAGRAARALGQARSANTILREAALAAKDDPAIQTEWGALFLDTHAPGEAAGSFRAALALDAQWAPAHAGLARALADEDPAAAGAAARRAVEIDPGLVEAHVFLASAAAEHDQSDAARQSLERALAVNPRDTEALALSAALALVADRPAEFDRVVAQALAVNPSCSHVFITAAAHAASHFRYEDAVVLARRAVSVEGDNPRAHAALGLHLLRTGEEREARRELEIAFRADAYDLVTYNLLQMLDRLETFATIRTGNVILRLDRDEAPVLRHYAVPLIEEAYRQMTARYGFEPKGPILVQVFAEHDDFAVRTAGLPGLLGALGVSFGRVVTLDSPRARKVPGSFNWQATLWHEMAHVFTMQLSGYRVPRWLTEGISVWEEGHVKPEWARDSEMTFAKAYADGKVPPLADLNRAFMRSDTVELAYFQSSLVVGLLADTYGERAVRDLVKAFAGGADTETALKSATALGLADLQKAFDTRLTERYGAMARALRAPENVDLSTGTVAALQAVATRHSGSYPVQMAVAEALAAAGHREAALAAFERARVLIPSATGPSSPRARAAELAERAGEFPRAMRDWHSLVADDHTNLAAARRLVPLARRLGQQDALVLALERVITLDPFDSGAHTALGRIAMERKNLPLALREFRAALASGPADIAPAHCDLAEAALAAGDAVEAKRAALAALDVAPLYARAQDLLLAIVDRKD